jgi:hypothetical protein
LWYDRQIAALMLGMNPGNARSRLHQTRSPYEGPEYAVTLNARGAPVGEGRTRDAAEVIACASAWHAHGDLEQLVRVVPFIGEKERAMRALASRLDPELRWDIGYDPGYELWVYGDDRSCEVSSTDGAFACRFFLGQAQVALGTELDNIPGAVAAWLISRFPVRLLATHVPGVEIEPHADVLETDPPRWHWLHLGDRIADPRDALARLRELIARLATSPVATTFYSFSSLNRLCFSASSHFPWVNDGLPVVAPAPRGMYAVNGTICVLDDAVHLIESELESFPVRPFFGSASHYELPLVAACLERQGSTLRPRLEQRRAGYDVVVRNAAGTRRCRISDRHVTFLQAADRLGASWPERDEAVAAIRSFCEGSASLDDIAADQRAVFVSIGGRST